MTTNTKKTQKALRMALEALEESLGYVEEEAENAQRLYGQYPTRQARIQGLKDDARKHMNAITAIRVALASKSEALAQAPTEQEQPAQQELVRYFRLREYGEALIHDQVSEDAKHNEGVYPLYTSPPASKPWVGLTDEEMRGLEKHFNAERVRTSDEEYLIIYPGSYWAWQRAIEAKLKEKNA